MQNETILLLVIFTFLVYHFYTQCTPKPENFTNDQTSFANNLLKFLRSNPSYLDYLEWLNANKNTSQNLIVKTNFINLLTQSKNNTLTLSTILNTM